MINPRTNVSRPGQVSRTLTEFERQVISVRGTLYQLSTGTVAPGDLDLHYTGEQAFDYIRSSKSKIIKAMSDQQILAAMVTMAHRSSAPKIEKWASDKLAAFTLPTEVKAEVKAEAKAEVKAEAKAEAKAETKTSAKAK
jgi:hypothetical protein